MRRVRKLEELNLLGDVPPSLQETVSAQKDEATLRAWHKLAAKAEGVEEFVKQIR